MSRSVAAHRFNNELRYRSEAHPNQTQFTPAYVLDPIKEALGGSIELDPCTDPDNPVRAERFYAPPLDGAEMPWDAQTIFVNPPYGKARERWVERCMQAADAGSRVVLLIPAHTDTRIFQKAAATGCDIVFIQGRVKFGVLRPNRRQVAASHPSALLCWNLMSMEPMRILGHVAPGLIK
ncbi:DNA N-6-adenine-methyltransferase [Arthrobacter liuii]|uniref:Adenine methyltransferase n=1 Tax=Arthrobacter liuii TaxID=1476996 RepID=A0ABQ2AR22_9MICC|nr:DNA N-6-adenine-methyltransferase [Arthrobacter liuii]GGH93859.1 hypothetical protein GCM10007170_15710 [Arthrobacter liuii]